MFAIKLTVLNFIEISKVAINLNLIEFYAKTIERRNSTERFSQTKASRFYWRSTDRVLYCNLKQSGTLRFFHTIIDCS